MSRDQYNDRADMIADGLSLDEQNDALLDKIAHLKLQISEAKGRAATTGDYSDANWFNRANHALRMFQREHQQCLREIGDRNKKQRREPSITFERHFMRAARARLDPDLYESLLEEAREGSLADGVSA